jgi:hypothetical protein
VPVPQSVHAVDPASEKVPAAQALLQVLTARPEDVPM